MNAATAIKNRNELEERLTYLISKAILAARQSFWEYCKAIHPDFYSEDEDKQYLHKLCDVLQAFYERKLKSETGQEVLYLIIEMPPRHGKTRTLVLFSSWVLGKNPHYKIITSAYNDTYAFEFSKFTRDTISLERMKPADIIYSDIFPKTQIKYGDSGKEQWALDKQYFSFKSAGKGGSITGKGGHFLISDDLVKNAEEAFNENRLNKDWEWFTGTWLSRREHGARIIVIGTPWSKNDVSGRLQQGRNKDKSYVFKLPAFDGEKMLCDSILSREEYEEQKRIMEPIIFKANYDLERVDVKGLLYGSDWKVWTELPRDAEGKAIRMKKMCFIDTADKGSDYFAAIWGYIWNDICYVYDVYYTKDPVEITEPEMAERHKQNDADLARYEGNSAGHAIAVHIERIMRKEMNWTWTKTECFTQTENKISRILANAAQVKDKIIMPADWPHRWPEFHAAVSSYLKEGKNLHDDGPDVLTQIVEWMRDEGGEAAITVDYDVNS
jgi:predicted phage terminase large subunit-like protein